MVQQPHPRSARRWRERGQGLVEFALVISVLLLIAIAILDLGRAIYAYSVVSNCAREGARYGVVWQYDEDRTDIETDIRNVVRNAAVGLDRTQLTVAVIVDTTLETIQVLVSYDFRLITPLVANAIGGGSLTLAASATMYTGH
jgi:Flp pilus assembly protein TadG